jgi:peroxiredoxin
MTDSKPSPWMQYVLALAAAYNLIWGAAAVLFPYALFRWAGMEQPSYPELWQCIGMIIAVYGVGYAVASMNPYRHWPIVLVGLLAKIFGPIGFLQAALHGRLPWRAGWLIVANDLIWWVPFSLILAASYGYFQDKKRIRCPEVLRLALKTRANNGVTLDQLSRQTPVLLVFLRHAGCTFCREAMADIGEQRRRIEATGTRVVLVHMGTDEQARKYLPKYGLADAVRINDTPRHLYRAFGLCRGTVGMLFGPKVWFRGFQAAILRRHWVGRWQGDAFQMPGVFLLCQGEVVRSYRHQSVADRPDYVRFSISDFPQLEMQS